MHLGVIHMPKKKSGRPKRENVIPPTPETEAKLDRSEWHIARLVRLGLLTAEHEDAAREIESLWRAIMRGLFKTQKYGRGGSGGDLVDRMTEAEARAHAWHYIPWTHLEAKVLLHRFPMMNRGEFTRIVCTLDKDPMSVYPWVSPPKGEEPKEPTPIDHLRMSLTAYARLMRAHTPPVARAQFHGLRSA